MVRRNSVLEVRREPVQIRSKATLEAILEAASDVINKRGSKATMAAIAERAGVSVGTLYQYLPGREALLALLLERHVELASAAMGQMLVVGPGETLEQVLARIVRGVAILHSIHPRLNQVLLEEARSTPRLKELLQTVEDSAMLAAVDLMANYPEIRSPDPRVAAHLLIQVVQAVAHHRVLHPDEGLEDERFVSEVTALLRAYLVTPR